jgi:hypothetical protein
MNPLGSPWSSRNDRIDLHPEGSTEVQYLGLRNTKLTEAKDRKALTIEVRGVGAVPSGPYKVAYSEGATLRYYLRQLRILHAASYSAVYDKANPEKGRCRLTYVPRENSEMLICPPRVGTATRFQRSNHDAEKVASKMGETP